MFASSRTIISNLIFSFVTDLMPSIMEEHFVFSWGQRILFYLLIQIMQPLFIYLYHEISATMPSE